MTDIVERLRAFFHNGLPVEEFVVVLEAADEIERLRAENAAREAVRMETLARQALETEQLRRALGGKATDTPQ